MCSAGIGSDTGGRWQGPSLPAWLYQAQISIKFCELRLYFDGVRPHNGDITDAQNKYPA